MNLMPPPSRHLGIGVRSVPQGLTRRCHHQMYNVMYLSSRHHERDIPSPHAHPPASSSQSRGPYRRSPSSLYKLSAITGITHIIQRGLAVALRLIFGHRRSSPTQVQVLLSSFLFVCTTACLMLPHRFFPRPVFFLSCFALLRLDLPGLDLLILALSCRVLYSIVLSCRVLSCLDFFLSVFRLA